MGAKAAGVKSLACPHGCCRCEDTELTQRSPGPTARVTAKQLPPSTISSLGWRAAAGGQWAPKPGTIFATAYPRGVLHPGHCPKRGNRHGEEEPSLCYVGVPGRVLLLPAAPTHSPSLSQHPKFLPQVLLCCRMWLCQAALPLQLITSPTLHYPALNHINPTNLPLENLTHNPKSLKPPRPSPEPNTSP